MCRIDRTAKLRQEFSRCTQLAAVQEMLSDQEIDTICVRLGHRWRDRLLPPAVTVRSLLYRRLHPDKSIQATLANLTANDDRIEQTPADTSWCEARSRLPAELWPELIAASAGRLTALAGKQYFHFGRPVYLVDGSTISMSDTPQLVEAFGYANTKHGPSRFPVARMTFLTQAGSEAVLDYRMDPYRTGEDAQFHAMWHQLPDGCICLCDRKFCSFYNLAKLPQRRIDMVSPLHQRRNARRLITTGKKIGRDQWLVEFALSPALRKEYQDASLPERLPVRLIRVVFTHNGTPKVLWLVTTLLDPRRFRRSAIVNLYRKRWGIETRIGSLKTTLEMNVVPSKTAKAVRYDVAATVLAHNLVWLLIHQSARQADVPAARISFAVAIKTLLAYSPALRYSDAGRRRALYDQMLSNIAHHTNRDRPGRIEPRLIKRQRKRYGFLKTTREQARRTA